MDAISPWLQQQLKAGESLAALLNARDGAVWYATTGRIIKYKRDRFEERVVEVPLDEIKEVQLQKHTNVRMMGYGSLFLFMGVLFLFLSFFTATYLLVALFLLIGSILFVYGYLKDTYLYQFQGDFLDEEEWQLSETTKESHFFVQSVRQLIGSGRNSQG